MLNHIDQNLYRNIVETIRSTLDIKEVKQKIVDVVGKQLKADRCFILEYDKINDKFFNVSEEYLSSSDILNYAGTDLNENIPKLALEFKKGKSLLLNQDKSLLDEQEIDLNDGSFEAEKNAIEYFKVYSALVFPVYYIDEFFGDLVLHYVDKKHEAGEDEINLLKDVAGQIAIALHQAKLYNDIKVFVEREKISKNIIEILRSSMDKAIIKKLFVKNIGKFFGADRVFFAEYDSNEKRLISVDRDSEYLSSPNEKSVIGRDWSQSFIKDYYKAVQEKREVKIFSMEEYIKDKELEGDIKKFLEEAEVKSSYSFPVFCQNKILGSFCIDFTRYEVRLSDEDISRIRSMCTQAGIALYHADLYEKAQQCNSTKESFKAELLNKVEVPAQEILDISFLLRENEFERPIELEYLNKIIGSCNQLLELTNNVSN